MIAMSPTAKGQPTYQKIVPGVTKPHTQKILEIYSDKVMVVVDAWVGS